MRRVRWLFVLGLLLTSLLTLGAQVGSAQSPTPIVVPTAPLRGCEQVPVYLDARKQIMDEFLADLEAVFPTVATPIMENGDQLFVAVSTMTPEQATELAMAYDTVADKIEKIEAPAVASFYNTLQVDLYRLSADVFEEVGRTSLTEASETFNDQLVAMGEGVRLAGEAATAACPAFAEVVEFDQTQAAL